MDQFNYLSVLLSIILGLAITQILKGFRGIALARARVIGYWPTYVFAALLLLIYVQGWWATFGLREIPQWTFAMFAIVLLQAIGSYMLAALVLPDFFGEERVDLRVHYHAHRKLFFGVMVATVLTSLLKDYVLSGHFTDPLNFGFHLGFIAISLGAMFIANEWYHRIGSVVSFVAFAVYIAMLFNTLH